MGTDPIEIQLYQRGEIDSIEIHEHLGSGERHRSYRKNISTREER
jgi:hypothetical protein